VEDDNGDKVKPEVDATADQARSGWRQRLFNRKAMMASLRILALVAVELFIVFVLFGLPRISSQINDAVWVLMMCALFTWVTFEVSRRSSGEKGGEGSS
jgi:hypothetical protein